MKTTEKLPAVLEQNVQNSGLELSKAQAIALNYAPLMIEAQSEAEKLKGLTVDNSEDVETAKRVRINLGRICSAAKKVKDEDKELIKIEDRYIMGLFNAVDGFARLTQKDALTIEKHAERLEAEAREKLKAERCEILAAYEIDGYGINVEHMAPEVWENYFNGVKLNFEQKKEAERIAEEQRIAKEKEEAEARESERLENERKRKEAEEAAKKAAAELAKLQKEREEKEKADAKERAKLQEIIDKERKEREALEKAAADLKAKEEKRQKEEAEEAKKAAKAPDIDKVKAALESCTIELPKVKDPEISIKVTDINAKFELFKDWAIDKLNAK